VKLFMLMLERNGTKDAGFDVVVHATDAETARSHVAPRFVGYSIGRCIELAAVTKHFVVTEWGSE
jgi:hypothetical protein